MTAITTTLSGLAQLAQASYSSFSSGTTGQQMIGALTGGTAGFSATQATLFANQFSVILQYNDDSAGSGGTGSSLSLTVFKDNSGRLTLAIRGTLEPGDFTPTDANIVTMGAGYDQIAALYNWWQRASTPAGQQVAQYRVRPVEFDGTSPTATLLLLYGLPSMGGNQVMALERIADASATGDLVAALAADSDHLLDVTGHSLGGHLAMAFGAMFPTAAASVTTFNAPGFTESSINQQFFSRLGGAVPSQSNIGAITTNVIANHTSQADVPWQGIAASHSRPGTAVNVPIERQIGSDEPAKPASFNHSQMILADALAVQALLSKLQPELASTTLTALLQAAANREYAGLERLVQGLQSFLGLSSTPLPVGNNQREALYQAIAVIQESTAFKALAGKVTIEATHPATASTAHQDFAALISLTTGATFSLRSLDATAVQTSLQGVHAAAYADWQADRQALASGASADALNFTDNYLNDRAALLNWRNVANIADQPFVNSPFAPADRTYEYHWKEGASAQDSVLLVSRSQSGAPAQIIAFGGDGADTLTGNANPTLGDRLYGGAGTDILSGLGGSDYLEGNSNDDSLDGGAGIDTLLGGAGNDTLAGGEGHDLLLGGAGADTYYFEGNIGLDIVRDSDGAGKIVIGASGSAPLSGGNKVAADTWISDDKKFTYVLIEGNLVIRPTAGSGASGILTVNDWTQGQLGITLSDTPAPLPATTSSYTGDFAKKTNPEGTQFLLGEDGQYVADGAQANALDLITGTGGADLIQGLGGDDALLGKDGNDIIEGGEGNDVLMGGLGADVLNGGAGRDLIYGSSTGSLQYPLPVNYQLVETPSEFLLAEGFNWRRTSDAADTDGYYRGFLSSTVGRDRQPGDAGNVIEGGAGDDTVFAGTGNDVVHGGDDRDDIVGMGGDDVLFGDEGGDRIYGDGPANLPDTMTYTPAGEQGRDILYGGGGNDLLIGQGKEDVLYGGEGNDILFGDDRDEANTPMAIRGDDYLDGGSGDDLLNGNEGDDILIGGTGSDTLVGGKGRDIYIFNRGDGVDRVYDTRSEGNVLRFGTGINASDITLHLGSLMLDAGNGDQIHIEGFDKTDALNSVGIESFEFADGSALSVAGLLARGFDIGGTEEDDVLVGTSVDDRIKAFGGNDQIYGSAGDDVLDGGEGADHMDGGDGNDVLIGGAGQDTLYGQAGNDVLDGGVGDEVLRGGIGDDSYHFGLGDGHDTINDTSGTDTIVFGEGITADSISVSMLDGLLVLRTAGGDSITIDGVVAQYRFADGAVFSREQIVAKLPPSQQPADPVRVMGADGNDVLVGGASIDYILGGAGDDSVDAALGDDVLFGDQGNDLMHAGGGADAVIGGIGNDQLHGDGGSDRLWGGDGDDSLYGGDGGDELIAGDGTDVMIGGRGDDLLMAGGTGEKTYRFDLGDGNDVLTAYSGTRHIEFGAGVQPGDIKMFFSPSGVSQPYVRVQYSSADSMLIQLGAGTGPLDYRFANGTVLTQASLAATATQVQKAPYAVIGTTGDDYLSANSQGNLIEGGSGNDQLRGGDLGDKLRGGSGADALYGFNGDEVIDGGAGNDSLLGGAGSDSYVYASGDGSDVITEEAIEGDVNVLRFVDLNATEVAYTREANGSLLVHINGSYDTIEIRDWYSDSPKRIQQIIYADGTVLNTSRFDNTLQSEIVVTPGTPVTGTTYGDVIVGSSANDLIDGRGGNDRVSGGQGSDTYVLRRGMGLDTIQEVAGDTNVLQLTTGLTFEQLVTQRQGNDLYVNFTAASDGVVLKNYFAGVGSWSVVSDTGQQKSMADVIADNGNLPAPETVEELRDAWISQAKTALLQSYVEDAASYEYWFASADSLIVDYPGYAQVNYAFDETTQVTDEAYFERVSNDTSQSEGDETTTVTRTQTYALTRYNVVGGDSGSTILQDFGNLDSNGQPTVVFVGPSGTTTVGTEYVTVTETVEVRVKREAEVLEHIIGGASSNVINTWGIGTVDAGDGDDLIYHSWEAYYPPGQFLYGGAGDDVIFAFGNNDMLIGGDGNDYLAGGQGNDTYHLIAAEVGTKIIDEAATAWFLPELPDGRSKWNEGDRYSVDTVEFGAGISLGDLTIRRGSYASPIDTDGSETSDDGFYDTLDFSWADGRVAKVLLARPGSWVSPENDGYGIEFFKFADGTTITMAEMQTLVAGSSEHSLNLWKGDGVQPLVLAAGVNSVKFGHGIAAADISYRRDGSDMVLTDSASADQWRLLAWYDNPENLTSFSAVFRDGTTITGAQMGATNHGPVVQQPIQEQSALEDSAWSFTIPADTFADPDQGDALSYTASMGNGGDLPSWLSFDASTGTFSGTASNGDVGSLTLKVTASDQAGSEISSILTLTVANTNDAPVVTRSIGDQSATEDQAWTFSVQDDIFADEDGGELAYSAALADGSALPSWVSFDPLTRTFAGTPLNAEVGNVDFKVTATDGDGAAVSATFTLAVANVNDAPSVSQVIEDQSVAQGQAWTYTVPSLAFLDADAGDSLHWSVQLADGAPLPTWLSFDAATRTLSGTPKNKDAGMVALQVSVADSAGSTAAQLFDLSVSETPGQNIVGTAAADVLVGGGGDDRIDGWRVPIRCGAATATIPTSWITPGTR